MSAEDSKKKDFTAVFKNADGNIVISGLDVHVKWYRSNRTFGPDQAEFEVYGADGELWPLLTWLNYDVEIFNADGLQVWEGYVNEAAVPHAGNLLGLTLEKMANRIAIAYTTTSIAGVRTRGTTDWAQDDRSVALYGIKERLLTLSDATPEQAEAERDRQLALLSKPQRKSNQSNRSTAVLYAKGFGHKFLWRYFGESRGRQITTYNKTGRVLIGWGMSDANNMGFAEGMLQDIQHRLGHLEKDDVIHLESTSASASGMTGHKVVLAAAEGSAADVVSGDDIEFEPMDDIRKDTRGLTNFKVGHMIYVDGPQYPRNQGFHLLETVGTFDVSLENNLRGGGAVNLEPDPADGSYVKTVPWTITQAQRIKLDGGVVNREAPDPTITITVNALGAGGIAQPFNTDAAWPLSEVWIEVKKVGNPLDNLVVELCENDSGQPGTVLATGTQSGLNFIDDKFAKMPFSMSPVYEIAGSTTYFIKVSRSGSLDVDNYYIVKVGKPVTYDVADDLRWNDGLPSDSWFASTRYELPMELWGGVITTEQIEHIYEDKGDFLNGIVVKESSGLRTRQYRNGDKTAFDEIEALLKSGTSGGDELQAIIRPGKILVIEKAPTADSAQLSFIDGSLYNKVGGMVSPGELPVGQWVIVEGIPQQINAVVGLSPYRIESIEFDVDSMTYSIEQTLTDFGAIDRL